MGSVDPRYLIYTELQLSGISSGTFGRWPKHNSDFCSPLKMQFEDRIPNKEGQRNRADIERQI